jgi:hypothetical protein
VNKHLTAALEDCTSAVVSEHRRGTQALVLVLVTCPLHAHKVVVINEGRTLITDADGMQCLSDNDVDLG